MLWQDREVILAAAREGVVLPSTEDFVSLASTSKQRIKNFKGWWVASHEVRTSYLLRELKFALETDSSFKEAAQSDGVLCSVADFNILRLSEDQITSEDGTKRLGRVNRLRSWYKGGRYFEQLAEEDRLGEGVTIEQRRSERLAWRTDFLQRRAAKVEEVWEVAKDLIQVMLQEVRSRGDDCLLPQGGRTDERITCGSWRTRPPKG